MSRSYAPWEPELEIHKETREFVNWLDRRDIPISTIKQIVNWTQFELEFSKLTDPCLNTKSCNHADLIASYYTDLSATIIVSKREGMETITPNLVVGGGMLVADTIDLMHSYYLDSGIWTKAEYKVMESLRAKVEPIEVAPGVLSLSLNDDNVLRICHVTTDPLTHETSGPCTTIQID